MFQQRLDVLDLPISSMNGRRDTQTPLHSFASNVAEVSVMNILAVLTASAIVDDDKRERGIKVSKAIRSLVTDIGVVARAAFARGSHGKPPRSLSSTTRGTYPVGWTTGYIEPHPSPWDLTITPPSDSSRLQSHLQDLPTFHGHHQDPLRQHRQDLTTQLCICHTNHTLPTIHLSPTYRHVSSDPTHAWASFGLALAASLSCR